MKDRAYEIARNPKYDGYQWRLENTKYKFFDKKTGLGVSVNEDLVEDLPKTMFKQFKMENNEFKKLSIKNRTC